MYVQTNVYAHAVACLLLCPFMEGLTRCGNVIGTSSSGPLSPRLPLRALPLGDPPLSSSSSSSSSSLSMLDGIIGALSVVGGCVVIVKPEGIWARPCDGV